MKIMHSFLLRCMIVTFWAALLGGTGLALAVRGNPYSNFVKKGINGLPGKTGQFSNFGGFNVQSKQLNNLTKFNLRNL